MRQLLYCLMVACGLLTRVNATSTDATAQPGPFAVSSIEQLWHDDGRHREVPVKIFYPKQVPGKDPVIFPVIIFSHGLGGSRDGYGYLGAHWASHGYVVVHVQHRGSDKEVMRALRPLKALRDAAAVPANAINRPLDIRFTIDQLTARNTDAAFVLHGQLDLSRIGVAGHSFGAFTTMAIAGAHFPVLGDDAHNLDPRVKAAIAMSTPTTQDNDAAFDDIKIPIFHMTGTKDESPKGLSSASSDPIVGKTKAAERLRPFLHTKHAPAYLLVFEDGDHLVFSGRLTESRVSDKDFQARVLSGSTAFWNAWLKEDKDARQWLDDGGFLSAVGKLGTFEVSHPQ